MSRKKEFKEIVQMIKDNFEYADCGLFNTRNILFDPMTSIYKGKYFTLEICFYYGYFEVFGTTDEEFKELKAIYEDLEKRKWSK